MKYNKAYSEGNPKRVFHGFSTSFFPCREYVTNMRPPGNVPATSDKLTTGDLQAVIRQSQDKQAGLQNGNVVIANPSLKKLRQEEKSWVLGEEMRILKVQTVCGKDFFGATTLFLLKKS